MWNDCRYCFSNQYEIDGELISSGSKLKSNTEVSVEITPNEGYKVSSVKVNGEEISLTTTSIVISSNTNVVVEFAEDTGSSKITGWVLVTDVSTLYEGAKVIIVAAKEDYAMSTTQKTNNRAPVAVTKDASTNTVTYTTTVQELTLKAGTTAGTWAFYTGSQGFLYAASSSNNYLKTQVTNNANGSWNISITSAGIATIKSAGSNTKNWMRFNTSANPKLFSCYSSGQTDISLYIWVE